MQDYNQMLEELVKEKSLTKWVCDLQQKTALDKFLRHITPTKVIITATQDYLNAISRSLKSYEINRLQKCTIYPFDKNGKRLSKEISPFGNHSWDHGVFYFDTEKQCVDHYNGLVYEIIKKTRDEKERKINALDNKLKDLESKFIGTDYVAEYLTRE